MRTHLSKAITAARGAASSLQSIKLLTETSLPVYLVHTQADPDHYDFFFDMEAYVASSKGYFTKPKFVIYTGTTDISRTIFATTFRECFENAWNENSQADEAGPAAANKGKSQRESWMTISNITDLALVSVLTGGAALAPILFLWAGLSSAERALAFAESTKDRLKNLNPMKAGSKPPHIDQKREEVEAALRSIELNQHPDLYVNYFGPGSPQLDIDHWAKLHAAWPLPSFVRSELKWTSEDLPTEQRMIALRKQDSATIP